MFKLKITKEQWEYARKEVANHSFANRGRGDGTKDQQLTGIVGQTAVADLLRQHRPAGTGFDNGVDFDICAKTVDVKTMGRTTDMRDYYVHNFVGYQKDFQVDFYIFTSLNKKTDELTVCGYVSKAQLLERASFYPAGTLRMRSDGSTFRTKAPLYELKQKDLEQVKDVADLIISINNALR